VIRAGLQGPRAVRRVQIRVAAGLGAAHHREVRVDAPEPAVLPEAAGQLPRVVGDVAPEGVDVHRRARAVGDAQHGLHGAAAVHDVALLTHRCANALQAAPDQTGPAVPGVGIAGQGLEVIGVEVVELEQPKARLAHLAEPVLQNQQDVLLREIQHGMLANQSR